MADVRNFAPRTNSGAERVAADDHDDEVMVSSRRGTSDWRDNRSERRHSIPAQIVLALGFTAIAAVVFVVGLLAGARIAPWMGGYGLPPSRKALGASFGGARTRALACGSRLWPA